MMSRRGNNNKFDRNGNKHAFFFDKDHMTPKEDYASLTPEIKYFWNSIPDKEKSSILRNTRKNLTPNPHFPTSPPFTRELNKSEIIEALIHEYLTLK